MAKATAINISHSANHGTPDTGYGTKNYRNYILGILLTVYIFNFIDRTIINILTEPIKESFGVEDWQMGLLGGPAFAILYTFVGIPIARFSEKRHRVWIIAGSVALWSLMTVFCGFATSFRRTVHLPYWRQHRGSRLLSTGQFAHRRLFHSQRALDRRLGLRAGHPAGRHGGLYFWRVHCRQS